MTYLLSIAIGPVQDFIAAARRCRDLWYGSWLLSEVSKAAAKSLAGSGARLIFPAPANDGDLEPGSNFTVVNKLLAIVETENIRGVADAAHEAARARLREAADQKSLRLRGLEIDWERYATQLKDILEFYAAWTPYTKHGEARARVEELAAGRKALRDFPPYQGVEGEPKSSLDGVREHVIRRRSERLYESNLKSNEWLDAIGVVKRFGGGYAPFDSTLDVAAAPYVVGRRAHHGEVMQRYDRFIRDHGLQDATYSLLYRHESRQIFEDDEVEQAELEDIRSLLGDPNPPYYAFLVGDGDKMGEAIGRIESEGKHCDFSLQLSKFAGEARRVIKEDYQGCPIYCGGDDVVALLPLHVALACARRVNEVFRESMKAYDVRFSAGMVVAHALEPLTEVREWARDAEKLAKNQGGRDALCVSVHPRSGADVMVVGKWNELTGLLDSLIGLYLDKQKKFSYGLAHEFRDIVEQTRDWEELHGTVKDLALAVARKKDCAPEAVDLIEKHAANWVGLETLCRAMLAARPFARARKEAS
jgi:CRISPR-associated protein Cmr2